MSIYRQIYETHFGPIPKDSDGRSYEIHHIDGNHENNLIDNLKCISIQEHFNIHYGQGDWGACRAMSIRMNLDPKEISRLASIAARKQVVDGTHNFLGGEIQKESNQRRVEDGTHHFLGGKIQQETACKRVNAGTHNFLGGKEVRKRVEDGTHNFLDGAPARERARKQIANGTHNFLQIHICPYCNKIGKSSSMFYWHFDNCKSKQ